MVDKKVLVNNQPTMVFMVGDENFTKNFVYIFYIFVCPDTLFHRFEQNMRPKMSFGQCCPCQNVIN